MESKLFLNPEKMKKKRNPALKDFHLIPHSSGIILDSIWVKDDNSEIIIKSAFGGQWNFRPLKENEDIKLICRNWWE